MAENIAWQPSPGQFIRPESPAVKGYELESLPDRKSQILSETESVRLKTDKQFINRSQMKNGDLSELKVCIGKLDYLSFALRNLSSLNGHLEEKDFRDNVARISRLLEGQMRWLSRNWPSLAVVLRKNNQPNPPVHKI